MPRLSRTPSASSHYGSAMPVSMAQSHGMGYYHGRVPSISGPNYYDQIPAGSSPPNSVDISGQSSYQDSFAVGPLPMPPTADGIGASVIRSGRSLPVQYPRSSSGAWSPQNDDDLINARARGENWSQIQQLFPGKTPNACRKRHERLMERRNADDFDTRKMELIAREYMNLRREIWAPLANRTGEKWTVVEQKCMASGLKNLQGASRSSARRERLEAGYTTISYDDDECCQSDDGNNVPSPPSGATNGNAPRSGPGSSITKSLRRPVRHVRNQSNSLAPPHQHHLIQQPQHLHVQVQSPTVVPTVHDVTSPSYSDYYAATAAAFPQSLRSMGVDQSQHQHPLTVSDPYIGHPSSRMSAAEMGIDSIVNRGSSRAAL